MPRVGHLDRHALRRVVDDTPQVGGGKTGDEPRRRSPFCHCRGAGSELGACSPDRVDAGQDGLDQAVTSRGLYRRTAERIPQFSPRRRECAPHILGNSECRGDADEGGHLMQLSIRDSSQGRRGSHLWTECSTRTRDWVLVPASLRFRRHEHPIPSRTVRDREGSPSAARSATPARSHAGSSASAGRCAGSTRPRSRIERGSRPGTRQTPTGPA